MKVTVILPEALIEQVLLQVPGKTLTESLKTALGNWVAYNRSANSTSRWHGNHCVSPKVSAPDSSVS